VTVRILKPRRCVVVAGTGQLQGGVGREHRPGDAAVLVRPQACVCVEPAATIMPRTQLYPPSSALMSKLGACLPRNWGAGPVAV
jgi:hypothetical protein